MRQTFYEKENKDVDKTKCTSPQNGRTIDGTLARLGSVGLGEGQARDHMQYEKRGNGANFACCSARLGDGIYMTQCLTRRDKYASEQKEEKTEKNV